MPAVLHRFSSTLAILAALCPGSSAADVFTAVGGEATVDGGLSRGVAFGDADGDGDPDLLVANTINYPEFLYRNDDGRFVQVLETAPSLAGGFSEGVSWIDFDNDGRLDVFVARTRERNALYRNLGDWQFAEHDAGPLSDGAAASSMACWADVDNDGWLDLFVVNRGGENDRLYRNVRGERFEPVTNVASNSGGDGRSCAFGDIDDDGDPDLYVGNFLDETGASAARAFNFLFVNDGGFRFSRVSSGAAVTSRALTYGTTWVDADGDGDLDLFVTNIGIGDGNHLYFNDGRGGLSRHDAGFDAGSDAPSKGHTWGDFDLDGDLDVAIANGTEGSDLIGNHLYLNDGAARFVLQAADPFSRSETVSAGIASADVDSDGDLDLYVTNWGGGDQDNALYRNERRGNFLVVELEGTASNRMGIGAKIVAEIREDESVRQLIRRHFPQTGYASQNEPVVHFGLGGARDIQRLTVLWPSGVRDVYVDVAANRRLALREGDSPTRSAEAGQ